MYFNMFMKRFEQWQKQNHFFVINKKRMQQMYDAYDKLETIVHKYSPSAKLEIDMNTISDGSAAICTEVDDFVVHDVHDFITVIKYANNFEIYPLNNGNMKIAIMFNGVMDLVK